jgi:hypothetical protein
MNSHLKSQISITTLILLNLSSYFFWLIRLYLSFVRIWEKYYSVVIGLHSYCMNCSITLNVVCKHLLLLWSARKYEMRIGKKREQKFNKTFSYRFFLRDIQIVISSFMSSCTGNCIVSLSYRLAMMQMLRCLLACKNNCEVGSGLWVASGPQHNFSH